MNKFLMIRTCSLWLKRNMCSPPAAGTPSNAGTKSTANISPRYRPSNFQKFILVWTKKFKTKEDIPDFVS